MNDALQTTVRSSKSMAVYPSLYVYFDGRGSNFFTNQVKQSVGLRHLTGHCVKIAFCSVEKPKQHQ
ncbi:hypothetical protein [Spirosoma gilvum]